MKTVAQSPIAEHGVGLFEVFAQRAHDLQDAVAVIDGDRHITYGEVGQHANALAVALRELKVCPGDVVGVSLPRGATLVASALAIWQIGATYLPLDPTYPDNRIRFAIEDSEARVVITEAAQTTMPGTRLLHPGHVLSRDAGEAIDPVGSDAPAYLVYTSGSTGHPKGVLGTHAATLNRFNWMWREFPFEPGEVTCAKTAIGFVDSIWELFGPLLGGAPAVMIPEAGIGDLSPLLDTLGEHHVTRLVLVPSLLRALLDRVSGDPFALVPDLRVLTCSGERLPADLARETLARTNGVELLNLYGSSEVAADVTAEIVREPIDTEVSIGRPIDGCTAHVLDGDRLPVPDGEVGELAIGGIAVADGYLNRAEETAERFVANPFAEDGGRMFLTGDRVYRAVDGRLFYVGRADDQISLRGHRIELAEVEKLLEALPMVDLAACASDGDRLIAAVVLAPKATTLSELRLAILADAPPHLVPDAFYEVDQLPLNPNGKVDRNAVRAMRSTSGKPEELQGGAERSVAAAFGRVLKIESVGPEDDFFLNGGHSLAAVRLMNEIRKAHGIDLPVAVLLHSSTVRDIAARVREAIDRGIAAEIDRDEPWDPTVIVHPGPEAAPTIFLFGGVGGNLNNLVELASHFGESHRVVGFQTRGILGHRAHPSIEAMAAENLVYLREHQPSGPYRLSGYSGGGWTALEVARQLEAEGETVSNLAIIDSDAPGYRVGRPQSLAERVRDELTDIRRLGMSEQVDRVRGWTRQRLARRRFDPILKRSNYALHRLNQLEAEWISTAGRYGGGTVSVPITLVMCRCVRAAAIRADERNGALGWHSFSTAPIDLHQVDSDHLNMVKGQSAVVVAAAILAGLASEETG